MRSEIPSEQQEITLPNFKVVEEMGGGDITVLGRRRSEERLGAEINSGQSEITYPLQGGRGGGLREAGSRLKVGRDHITGRRSEGKLR